MSKEGRQDGRKAGKKFSNNSGTLLLFEIRNRIVPTGSTPKGGPTEVSPTTQATRHPRALLLFMFPIPPYLLSCILHPVSPLPRPPVLYRYPTKYLVCPLPVFLSYKTPHIWTPQKPHI